MWQSVCNRRAIVDSAVSGRTAQSPRGMVLDEQVELKMSQHTAYKPRSNVRGGENTSTADGKRQMGVTYQAQADIHMGPRQTSAQRYPYTDDIPFLQLPNIELFDVDDRRESLRWTTCLYHPHLKMERGKRKRGTRECRWWEETGQEGHNESESRDGE